MRELLSAISDIVFLAALMAAVWVIRDCLSYIKDRDND